MHVVNKKL